MPGDVHNLLAEIWFWILGLILMLYVTTDGFDLGVGILSLFACDEDRRTLMMASLGSVWDANETWLVLLGGALFGAFPIAYAGVLHALYIPISVMLFALIFRGVAFEFRAHAHRKWPWNLAFGLGSLSAALSQGYILGALIHGLPLSEGGFNGGPWDWFSGFSTLAALGVVAGYSLLGATYLIMKTEGEIQHRSVRRAWIASLATLAAGIAVTLWTPQIRDALALGWFQSPDIYRLAPLPLAALLAFAMLWRALIRRRERAPFVWSLVIFSASFVGLAGTLYPYVAPPGLTLYAASASSKTLVVMLAGIGMLIPIMLVYNAYQYLTFRGKVQHGAYSE